MSVLAKCKLSLNLVEVILVCILEKVPSQLADSIYVQF